MKHICSVSKVTYLLLSRQKFEFCDIYSLYFDICSLYYIYIFAVWHIECQKVWNFSGFFPPKNLNLVMFQVDTISRRKIHFSSPFPPPEGVKWRNFAKIWEILMFCLVGVKIFEFQALWALRFCDLTLFWQFFPNFENFFSKIDQWRRLVAEFGINQTTAEKLLFSIMT